MPRHQSQIAYFPVRNLSRQRLLSNGFNSKDQGKRQQGTTNDTLKPIEPIEEAKQMLKELSDNTHEVVTGVTIICNDKVETFSNIAKVTFYPLSDEEIDEYIKTNEPMDKAGSYAIQGDGAKFVKSIDGDFYTIVGLPVAELYHRLKKYITI